MTGWARRGVGCGVALALVVWLSADRGEAAECKAPRAPAVTVLGLTYCVDPAFSGVIRGQVQ